MKTAYDLLEDVHNLSEGMECLTEEEQEILRDFIGEWIGYNQARQALDDLFEGIPYDRRRYESI